MKKIQIKVLLSISLISLFVFSGLVDMALSARTDHTAEMTTNVVIFSNRLENAAYVSLGLDDRINVDVFTKEMDESGAVKTFEPIQDADVFVFDTYLPEDEDDAIYLVNLILTNDIGVVFFGGNYSRDSLNVFEAILPAYFTINRDVIDAVVDNSMTVPIGIEDTAMNFYMDYIYNDTVEFTILENQIQVSANNELEDIIFIDGIAWQSCPLLRQRFSTFAQKPNTFTLVEVPDTKEPLVVLGDIGDFTAEDTEASVLFISTGVAEYTIQKDGINETAEMNTAFKLWPYFNYFMYLSVFYLTNDFDNSNLESYAEWPYSPIPHEREATLWMTFVAFLWVFNFSLFFYLGKKKKVEQIPTPEENKGEDRSERDAPEGPDDNAPRHPE